MEGKKAKGEKDEGIRRENGVWCEGARRLWLKGQEEKGRGGKMTREQGGRTKREREGQRSKEYGCDEAKRE